MSLISPHYDIKELVDSETYQKFGDNSKWFIRKQLVIVLEALREDLGPLFVNTWGLPNPMVLGQIYNWSGLRTDRYYEEEAKRLNIPLSQVKGQYSQHRFYNAFDVKSQKYVPDEIREYIRKNFKKLNELGLTTIEKDTPSWTHIDGRWTGSDKLLEVPFQ